MFIIGIDMSKETFHVAFHDNAVVVYPNTIAGFGLLIHELSRREYIPEQTRIGVESTGTYHLPLCVYLRKHQWTIVILNPLSVSRAAATRLRPTKTDRIDAKLIREVTATGVGYVFNDSDDILTLKSLVAKRGALVRIRAGLKQRIESERFREAPQTATTSGCYGRVLSRINAEIKAIERCFSKYEAPTQRLLRSIPGVGITSAAALVSTVVDVGRFSDAKKLTAYLGLDCRVKESGTSVHGKGYLTKRGNRYLRFVLFNATVIAKRYIPELQMFYQKKKTEGHHHFSALCATERKLVHLIYAVWTRGTPFERRSQ